MIPNSVIRIANCSFSHCANLTNVTIPDSVTSIGSEAFYSCSKLISVIFDGNAPSIGRSCFNSVNSDCTVYVRRDSTGWGVTIPGTWNGLKIRYLEDLKFSLTLYPNGGTYNGSTDATTVSDCLSINATAYWDIGTPMRDGYVFAGWFTSPSDGEMVYDATGKCVAGDYWTADRCYNHAGDLAVYAVWQPTLTEALDNAALAFSTGGESGWIGVADGTANGGDSIRSGIVPSYGYTSYFDTTVTNRGTLSFWYKVSGGTGDNLFAYRVDSDRRSLMAWRTNGTDGAWIQETCCITNDGAHLVRWIYYPYEASGSDLASDCAWVDQVVWSPLFTFDGNGGTPAASNINYVAGRTYGTMPNVSRVGYLMTGWFTSPDGGTQVISTQTVPGVGATYYAHWTPKTYVIRFNANGGTGTMADMAMTYDAAGNLPANGFSRAGYTFAGWAVSASGHAVYADGAGVANLSSTQGAVVTLYAVWRTSLAEAVDNVAIGFSSATGWTGVADPTAYGGNSAQSGMVSYGQTSFMDTAVTNRGTLSFRYKVSGGRGGDLFAYRVDSERKSLTAGRTNGTDGEWIQETCCITNDGVHLVRWVYYPYEYTGVDVTNDCACIDQVAWSPLFTFDGNGGTPAVSNISYVAGNTYGTMPNASRTGYLMTGWFTAPEGGTQVISTYTVPNVGATYYAHWRENTHGATYDVNIGGKTVAVPQAWIAGHPALVDAAGGDAVAALNSTAANGRMSVVECYVVGLDPEKADEDFKITSLPMKADGTPDLANIAFTPARETWNVPEATPVLKGAERLEGEWQTVTEENKEAFRFFKVVVEVP